MIRVFAAAIAATCQRSIVPEQETTATQSSVWTRFDRWLRVQAEARYGPLETWRLTKWVEDRQPLYPLARFTDSVRAFRDEWRRG
jgi:hypothetical protein